MDTAADDVVELDGTGVRVVVVTGGRRAASVESVLRAHLAASAGVPSDDVELDDACPVCGVRHGSPVVRYPTTPSGGAWFADAATGGGVVVAAVGTRHPVGVGVEAAAPEPAAALDAAALHPEERERLAVLDPSARSMARAQLWARKAALLRAVGHVEVLEPARIALTAPGDDGGDGRVVRSVPELGPGWEDLRILDVAVPGRVAASVAVLPRR
ncbi:hypothetical protein GCM10009819_26550 [Agromyces tropicus]|uniref:4'-phosphopantetheinyl transferase superfamily protein n=1 Tax=Agromyces tropicus TaxID=555371 RepID=A0ABP5G6Z7_9MICO